MEETWSDTLLRCIQENNPDEWNTLRRKNRKVKLSFLDFELMNQVVEGFNLKGMEFSHANFSSSIFLRCMFDQSILENLQAFGAKFWQCSFVSAKITNGNLVTSTFEECDLRYADLSESSVHQSFIQVCKADNCICKKVSFYDSCLGSTSFANSNLTGSEFKNVVLYHTDFTAVTVDGDTIFWDCYYDKKTNFTGVGLGSCRIEPVLLSSFQCNIRRIWWENWYQEKREARQEHRKKYRKKPLLYLFQIIKDFFSAFMTFVIEIFWWITDYGSSTTRLVLVFLATTVGYSLIYNFFPQITNDIILQTAGHPVLNFFRSLYFSVIIMTGLGFGDIHASGELLAGHIIMMLQSLMGYILLGAFLVRIGILFQGEFPVASIRKKKTEDLCENENLHTKRHSLLHKKGKEGKG